MTPSKAPSSKTRGSGERNKKSVTHEAMEQENEVDAAHG